MNSGQSFGKFEIFQFGDHQSVEKSVSLKEKNNPFHCITCIIDKSLRRCEFLVRIIGKEVLNLMWDFGVIYASRNDHLSSTTGSAATVSFSKKTWEV